MKWIRRPLCSGRGVVRLQRDEWGHLWLRGYTSMSLRYAFTF